ncbi:MAG: diacylglycerol/lipid kinase family protein [Candidatus Planktophila sp.]
MIVDGARRLNVLILAINPTSGNGKARQRAKQAEILLSRSGIESLLIEGSSLEDFRAQLLQALQDSKVTGVIACGGDGFIHEIIQHVVPRALAFGVIPCGTGNDFARSLGVYSLSFEEQINLIATQEPKNLDLGKVGQRWFAAILSTGFDALVNERANQMRWPKGKLKYNLAMIEKLIFLRPHRYRISMDQLIVDVDATLITIANGSSYGGGMKVCPQAALDDARFDVMILNKVSRFELLRVFPKVYFGRHVGHPAVTFYRCESIEIQGAGSSYADGEPISALPLSARCVPGALLAWSV